MIVVYSESQLNFCEKCLSFNFKSSKIYDFFLVQQPYAGQGRLILEVYR
jgi:hypothetical protein